MIESQQILELMPSMLGSQILANKKVVVTAGPTREAIDPVRYISNCSSGKMGYALAEAAQEAGGDVVLISGPTNLTPPAKVKFCSVQTAEEMRQAVMREVSDCDIFIAAAAVADYRPKSVAGKKIKKGAGAMKLELQANPDIVAQVASLARKPFVIGFAAETEGLLTNARQKLANKKLDMVIANKVGKGVGFDSDENEVTILCKKGKPLKLARTRKTALARQIIKTIHKF